MAARIAPLLFLVACVSPGPPQVLPPSDHLSGRPPLSAMSRFSAAPPPAPAPQRPNAEIARDFLDLAFHTENGTSLPVLSRFEGPITLRVLGPAPVTARADLSVLLTRLAREARIAIRPVPATAAAAITIEFVPRAAFRRHAPQAACFVVPGVSAWRHYRRQRNSRLVDWAHLRQRTRIAIFIPAGSSPQETRDCLHEELAQALGPVNDLYRLTDSVFNDDNLQSVLTGFDMLILRAFYAPELSSGMPPEAVAQHLPAILARLNPAGRQLPVRPWPRHSPQAWIRAIRTAHGAQPGSSREIRRRAALQAIRLARAGGLLDNRLALSLYTYGRLGLAHEPQSALAALNEALILYNRLPETRIHAAHVLWQLAVQALSAGDHARAAALSERALPAAVEKRNAALAATLLMIRAEALERLGRVSEAHQIRLDSMGWARYGFGSERKIRQQLRNIRALAAGRYRQGKS